MWQLAVRGRKEWQLVDVAALTLRAPSLSKAGRGGRPGDLGVTIGPNRQTSDSDGEVGKGGGGKIGVGSSCVMGECVHPAAVVRSSEKRRSIPITIQPPAGAGRIDRTAFPPRKEQGGLRRGAFRHSPAMRILGRQEMGAT